MTPQEELIARLKAAAATLPKEVEEPLVKTETPVIATTTNNPQLDARIKEIRESRNKTKLEFAPDPLTEAITSAVMKARMNRDKVLAILKGNGMDSQQAEKAYILLTELQ